MTMNCIAKIVNQWDPIGLFPLCPHDEYSPEIEKIQNAMCTALSKEVLGKEIFQIFSSAFVESFTKSEQECTLIADRIIRSGRTMRVFIELADLLELERAERWDDARKLLYDLWNSDKGNVKKLCRLIAECWYVLIEWDCCIQNQQLNYDTFQQTLMKAMEYGLSNCHDDATFLWMAGYTLSLSPHLFCKNGNDAAYAAWEQRGKRLLQSAVQLEPDNLIAKVFYLGTQTISEEYLTLKAQVAPCLEQLFPGDSAVEVYFKDVLMQ